MPKQGEKKKPAAETAGCLVEEAISKAVAVRFHPVPL
jgi:hypothetical protein